MKRKKIVLILLLLLFSTYLTYEYTAYNKQLKLITSIYNGHDIMFRHADVGNLVYVSGKLPNRNYFEAKVIPLINNIDSIMRSRNKNFSFPLIKNKEYYLEIDTINNRILFYIFLPSKNDKHLANYIDMSPFVNSNKATKIESFTFFNFLIHRNYNILIYDFTFPFCPDDHTVSYNVLWKQKFPYKVRNVAYSSKNINRIKDIIRRAGLQPVLIKLDRIVAVKGDEKTYSFVYDSNKKEVRSFCPNIPKQPNKNRLDTLAKLISQELPKIEYLRFPLRID